MIDCGLTTLSFLSVYAVVRNGCVNRAQIKDGVRLLSAIVPAIIELMLDHPELELGEVVYSVVG